MLRATAALPCTWCSGLKAPEAAAPDGLGVINEILRVHMQGLWLCAAIIILEISLGEVTNGIPT